MSLAPANVPELYGWTSSSVMLWIAVYDGPAGIGRRLSAASSAEPCRCCQTDGVHRPPAQSALADATPSLEPAKVMSSSTICARSGYQRIAQRVCRPPWLWPMRSILRPVRRASERTAATTYWLETWMSPSARSGSWTRHQSKPASGSVFPSPSGHVSVAVVAVPCTSRTTGLSGWLSPPGHVTALSSLDGSTSSAGPCGGGGYAGALAAGRWGRLW